MSCTFCRCVPATQCAGLQHGGRSHVCRTTCLSSRGPTSARKAHRIARALFRFPGTLINGYPCCVRLLRHGQHSSAPPRSTFCQKRSSHAGSQPGGSLDDQIVVGVIELNSIPMHVIVVEVLVPGHPAPDDVAVDRGHEGLGLCQSRKHRLGHPGQNHLVQPPGTHPDVRLDDDVVLRDRTSIPPRGEPDTGQSSLLSGEAGPCGSEVGVHHPLGGEPWGAAGSPALPAAMTLATASLLIPTARAIWR